MLVALGALLLLLTGWGIFLQAHGSLHGFVFVALAQGALYLSAVWLVVRYQSPRHALALILAVAALMRVGAVLTPPYLSDDLYRYIWDGRVEAAGINPYRYVPSDTHLAALRDATIYPNINRRTYAPTIYPPVAEYIFLAATRLSESVSWMKATMAVFDVAGMVMLLRLLALIGLPRERILIYAWHPLPIWEFAGSGHVDAVVVGFVALALWWRRREAAWLTGVALACAALVKFFPAVIFPALYRRWDWKMPLAAVAVTIAAYLPFIGAGLGVLGFVPGYISEEGLDSGAGFFVWNLLHFWFSLGKGSVLLYLAAAAAVLAAAGIHVILSDLTGDRFFSAVAALAALFTLLLSPHFPWYFAWLVPFLCFAPSPAMLYLSVSSLLLYFISGGPDLDGGRTLIEAFIYGPFAALAALEFARRRTIAVPPALIKRQA
jgi:alpha-1,6-mannosyltransferase